MEAPQRPTEGHNEARDKEKGTEKQTAVHLRRTIHHTIHQKATLRRGRTRILRQHRAKHGTNRHTRDGRIPAVPSRRTYRHPRIHRPTRTAIRRTQRTGIHSHRNETHALQTKIPVQTGRRTAEIHRHVTTRHRTALRTRLADKPLSGTAPRL